MYKQDVNEIVQQTDALSAIQAYKQLLTANQNRDGKYYQEVILNLCRLLDKNGLYGEALYYRLGCRYYFDSMLDADPELFREDTIKQAYSRIVLDLTMHRETVQVLILDSELKTCTHIAEIIKHSCNQRAYIFPGIENRISNDTDFMKSFNLVIICHEDPGQSANIITGIKKQYGHLPLIALYSPNGETARQRFQEHNSMIDYILYNELMVYAVLHIVLKRTGETNHVFN